MKNVGGADRLTRIILGIALLALLVVLPGYWKLLGRNTCKIRLSFVATKFPADAKKQSPWRDFKGDCF
ncbi:YgaP-like transmembrane domain [Paenibacillus yonginensis]|uniref:YgaP-like transmembrane domain n=1 Tax=Paenibacillus yonginensis TaxID=1462996 RepID=UPI0009F1EE7A|nr:YgaP-like transmembrane domain [Paenibacillus yonginensis]